MITDYTNDDLWDELLLLIVIQPKENLYTLEIAQELRKRYEVDIIKELKDEEE